MYFHDKDILIYRTKCEKNRIYLIIFQNIKQNTTCIWMALGIINQCVRKSIFYRNDSQLLVMIFVLKIYSG